MTSQPAPRSARGRSLLANLFVLSHRVPKVDWVFYK